MTRQSSSHLMLYPALGSSLDLGFFRVSGAGLGNAFFPYFHSVVIAEMSGGYVITPPWRSVKPARILRGRFGERSYFGVAHSMPDELSGFRKLTALALPRWSVNAADATDKLRPGYLNVVTCRPFVFGRLHEHRDLVRNRLLELTRSQAPSAGWGRGDYIALHVRLGDFGPEMTAADVAEGRTNHRLPFAWYLGILNQLRVKHPGAAIRVISDGSDEELAPLIEAGARPLRSGSDMGDLLALAGASILIGSNSTFSQWAAFLGDMPSIWLDKPQRDEKPTSDEALIAYAGLDGCLAKPW